MERALLGFENIMSDSISYVLIGGYAASHAATTIRESDSEGRIVLLTAENYLPYERPPLSKQLLAQDEHRPSETFVHPQSFYDERRIEVRTGSRVASIDRAAKTVQLDGGETLHYEKLLLATGASAKAPEFPGSDFDNVYILRNLDHSRQIHAAMKKGETAAVIGGSYLGLEAASGCLQNGVDVTVIDSHEGPWSKFASPDLQKFLVTQYEARGAKFVFKQRVEKIEGDGRAESVQTEAGPVKCDFVIAATGSKLNLRLAQEAGLEVDEKLGIVVDEHYRSSDASIWAAGDCIHYPDPVVGKMWHNEHYTNAEWSGKIAGANMSGGSEKLERAPYFFSDFLDFHMVLRGNPGGGKSARVIGSMEDGEFVELYGDEDGVLKMGVGISRNKGKSEVLAEKLEVLVKSEPKVSDVDNEGLGF
jgi:3-phenylpropionate/trans-cinnamate dioxygenase ferredoxin reductase subunit